MKNIIGIFVLISTFSCASFAGILLEPYLGYDTGTISAANTTLGVETSADSKLTGTAYGLRLGYNLPMFFWFALDGSMGTGKSKSDLPGSTDEDFKKDSLGIDVGMNFPILLRAWLGYNFVQNLTAKGTGGAGDTIYKGTATKLGLSFTGLPVVCLNLEYIIHNYTTLEAPGIASGTAVSNFYSKFNSNSILLSISAPFNF